MPKTVFNNDDIFDLLWQGLYRAGYLGKELDLDKNEYRLVLSGSVTDMKLELEIKKKEIKKKKKKEGYSPMGWKEVEEEDEREEEG